MVAEVHFAQANQRLGEKAYYCAPAGALAISGLPLQGDARTALPRQASMQHAQASSSVTWFGSLG